MRRFVLAGLLVLGLTSAAHAEFFGALTTANVAGQGRGSFTPFLAVGDATIFGGLFTYGLAEKWNGRVKIGIVDQDGADASLGFGFDAMYQFMKAGVDDNQVSLAFGGVFEYADFDFGSYLQVGPAFHASYPFVLDNGRTLEPYGRVVLGVERRSVDIAGISASDSDFDISLAAGGTYNFSSDVTGLLELQLDDNFQIIFAVELGVI